MFSSASDCHGLGQTGQNLSLPGRVFFSIFLLPLFTIFMFSLITCTTSYAQENPGTWNYYKSHFISSEGRVIDLFQNKISHSEGQGYGLLLSLMNGDRATFERIVQWTRNNLMVRKDGLAAWSWGQRDNGEWGVLDYNNASDGDLLIAWALLNGSEKWQKSEWKEWAYATLGSIRQSLIIKKENRMILLPGFYGFTGKSALPDQAGSSDAVTLRINVSYFLFPAFNDFADACEKSGKEEDKKFWKDLYSDSIAVLKQSLAGSMNLPPDWINIDAKGNSVKDKSSGAEFGYNAIRVPLYLAMAHDKKALVTFLPYLKLCEKYGYVPVVVDLSNEQIAIQEAPAGFHAVLAECAGMVGEKALSSSWMKQAEIKIRQEPDDYYSNTLYLLARSIQER